MVRNVKIGNLPVHKNHITRVAIVRIQVPILHMPREFGAVSELQVTYVTFQYMFSILWLENKLQ